MHDAKDYYYHSHTSVNDGSPAMVLAHTWTTIWLQNEDGHVWSDPIGQWERIENPVFPPEWDDEECGFCQTKGCEGDCDAPDDFDYTSIDYPEYDAQTAFFEREGRPMFPNEY